MARNRVRRMERIWTPYREWKWAWQCVECGRVWESRSIAAYCPHKDEYTWKRYRFRPIRREPAEETAGPCKTDIQDASGVSY